MRMQLSVLGGGDNKVAMTKSPDRVFAIAFTGENSSTGKQL